jgi:hypothetical protein
MVDRALIYEGSQKQNVTEYANHKRRLKDLVLWWEELGQLRKWRWGAFHPKGHKDVLPATLKFNRRRFRYRSCAGNVIGFVRDHVEWRLGLATGVASLVTLARTMWAKEVLRSFCARMSLRACS